jgi:hypothetical protein
MSKIYKVIEQKLNRSIISTTFFINFLQHHLYFLSGLFRDAVSVKTTCVVDRMINMYGVIGRMRIYRGN